MALGKQIIRKTDPRVNLEEAANGNTLIISLAEVADAGVYTCQVKIK